MDKKLVYNENVLNYVRTEFDKLNNSITEITFEIWKKIPENFLLSYYENEQIINPIKTPFDVWKINLHKRPKQLYSIGLNNKNVVSSVYGGIVTNERTLNLWATKSEFQQKGIGKTVLLNFIKHCFENNPEVQIRAWDVTSEQVNLSLTKIGFN